MEKVIYLHPPRPGQEGGHVDNKNLPKNRKRVEKNVKIKKRTFDPIFSSGRENEF